MLSLSFLFVVFRMAEGHARWKCPPPRSSATGIKRGPCGRLTNDFSVADDSDLLEIEPGPLTVQWEESVTHDGSPFRIALTRDGTDNDVCVLLDHIPHKDNPLPPPEMGDEDSYVPYQITLQIPDITCERCSLHLANPMTDKIGNEGAPDGAGCTDPEGTCTSVYYSCTQPFRIKGNALNKANNFTCPSALPVDWPLVWTGDRNVDVTADVPGVYRRQAALWTSDGWLQSVPQRFRKAVGFCSETMAPHAVPTRSPMSLSNAGASTEPTLSPSDISFPFVPSMDQPSACKRVWSMRNSLYLVTALLLC